MKSSSSEINVCRPCKPHLWAPGSSAVAGPQRVSPGGGGGTAGRCRTLMEEVAASAPGPCSQTASDGHEGFSWGAFTLPPPSCWSFRASLGFESYRILPGLLQPRTRLGTEPRSSPSHSLEARSGSRVSAALSPSGVTDTDSVPGPAPSFWRLPAISSLPCLGNSSPQSLPHLHVQFSLCVLV